MHVHERSLSYSCKELYILVSVKSFVYILSYLLYLRELTWGKRGVGGVEYYVGWAYHQRRPLTYSLRAVGLEPGPCSDKASFA